MFRRFRPAKGAPAAAQRSWARRKAHPAVAELLKLKPGFTVQSCAIILASSKVSGGRAGGRQEDGLSGATTFGVRLAKPRKVRFVSRAATRSPASIGGPVSRSQCNEGFGAVSGLPKADYVGPVSAPVGCPPPWPAVSAQRRLQPAGMRRVEVWRGGVRLASVSAPFVWRCLSGSAVAPFPHPAHR